MKKVLFFTSIVFLFGIISTPRYLVLAADQFEYKVLAPLPGTGIPKDCQAGDANCKTTLDKYLPGMFNLLIGLAAAITVLRIVWGGMLYLSSDAIQKKEEGKGMIENAIKGLVLVLAAWLILNTIDPRFTQKIRLSINNVTIAPPANEGELTAGGTRMTDAEIAASNAIRAKLADSSIGVGTYTGPCSEGQTRLCVNLNGLEQSTIDGVAALRKDFGKFINITGGTEQGHSQTGGHSDGKSLDFGQLANPNYNDLTKYIQSKDSQPKNTSKGPLYTFQINGKTITALHESGEEHWHITFN